MTIEIDDAGTGDPLLGAVIGFYRRETDQLHFEWIPLDAYQAPRYYKELPQEECAKAVMRGLLAMNIKEDEVVMICSGSIFDKARQALDDANITHEPLKVEASSRMQWKKNTSAATKASASIQKACDFRPRRKTGGTKSAISSCSTGRGKTPRGVNNTSRTG